MMDYKILINEEKQYVTFEGIHWGYGLGNTLVLWEYLEHSGLVVVKKPGASNWSGRGQSSYSPAEFMVLRVTEKLGAGWMHVDQIIRFRCSNPRSAS